MQLWIGKSLGLLRTLTNSTHQSLPQPVWLVALGLGCLLSCGCAAFHPIQGVPARYLPEELRGVSRAHKRTLDLSLLTQPEHPHQVDAGDVLAIYIEGILGNRLQPQPVNLPVGSDSPPSFGFPIPVREDGTISLPLIGRLNVRGKSIAQVETQLRQSYTVDKRILNPKNDRILVSLQRPRHYRVLVIRQEAPTQQTFTGVGMINLGMMKRGTGQVVNLPAYKNDVLNALAQTGGLPGLDAENAIYVIRNRKTNPGWTPAPNSSLPENQPPDSLPVSHKLQPRTKVRPVIRAQTPAFYGDQARYVEPSQNWPDDSPMQQTSSQFPGTPFRGPQHAVPTPRTMPQPVPMLDWNSGPVTPPQQTPQSPIPLDQSAQPNWPYDNSTLNSTDPQQDPVMMTPEQFGWDGSLNDRRVVKIPIRLGPGETVDLQKEDVILEDGDIVFIESRDTEVYYIGGLLGGGQFTLPRDYDLNVLQAIAVAQGQRVGAVGGASRGTQSLGGQSALNSDVSISASRVVILRYLEDGRMFPIEVDLYKARTDPAEQVIIQPGDYIILQYTKPEAVAAFFERHLLEGALFGVAAAQLNKSGN